MKKDFVATGFVVYKDKTLLVRHKKLNTWLPPGGHIHEEETPEEALKREGLYTGELIEEVSKRGSIAEIEGLPETLKHVFRTSHDVPPRWHVRIQAAFQKHTDNAVSKTVNLPEDASPEDVREIFLLAYSLKCKGITVFRYGSKTSQVLTFGRSETRQNHRPHASPEYSGGRPCGDCIV